MLPIALYPTLVNKPWTEKCRQMKWKQGHLYAPDPLGQQPVECISRDNTAGVLISLQALVGFCIFWCLQCCWDLIKLPFHHQVFASGVYQTATDRGRWPCSPLVYFEWNAWFQILGLILTSFTRDTVGFMLSIIYPKILDRRQFSFRW